MWRQRRHKSALWYAGAPPGDLAYGEDMRRPSVLVVDDDAFSRAVVSRRVAKLSDVVEAEVGLDALAHLQTAEFDLAIVDLEMPNFNGLELIKSVRSHP